MDQTKIFQLLQLARPGALTNLRVASEPRLRMGRVIRLVMAGPEPIIKCRGKRLDSKVMAP
jgi:hypothetical protein